MKSFHSEPPIKLPVTEKRRKSHEIPQDLSFWRRTACQILSKTLTISSATAQADPDLLKSQAILSDTTVRRPAIDWEDLKPY